jgi:hypothetical protein
VQAIKIIAVSFVAALAIGAGASYIWLTSTAKQPTNWNSGAIQAKYIGAQLKETDAEHASLVLTYEIRNTTGLDSRLADGPNFVVMSRLRADHSLSSQDDIRLSYPTFLPAGQSARVALEVRHPFSWPAENDPTFQNKLKELVNQRLGEVEAFVLFDQADHYQIEFPSGWQELPLATAGGD